MEVTLPVVSEEDCHGWKVRHRTSGHEMLAELVAYWELKGEAISEEYAPENMSAADLLSLMVRSVSEHNRERPHPHLLVCDCLRPRHLRVHAVPARACSTG